MTKSRFATDLKKFEDAVNVINEQANSEIRTISEPMFANKILPILQEWVVNKRGDELHLWAIYAGGIERPMVVKVPDDPKGVGYFMVPPPYNHINRIDARNPRENRDIHSVTQLIAMKELDGETRTAMELSKKLDLLIDVDENVQSHAMYIIQLAKIWERYGLPMEQVLSDLEINLDNYDAHGILIKEQSVTADVEEDHEEDEYEW